MKIELYNPVTGEIRIEEVPDEVQPEPINIINEPTVEERLKSAEEAILMLMEQGLM